MDDRDGGSRTSGRIAAALANIARGAASGGLAGAAAGAVESFLPELLKIGAVLLCMAILMPMLLLAAIPNILFGFPSVTDGNVAAMGAQADLVGNAYALVDSATQERIDEILGIAKAEKTDENGAPFYDDIEVETQTDHTNIFWFIAINSVAHQQDLFRMSPESIRDMVVQKLVWTVSIILKPVGEGESAGMIRLLRVDITDLDPEQLMDKLGFSQQEKIWAGALYETLSEKQYAGVEDGDGPGYSGTNYGDITFTDAETPVVYYNQTDARWGGKLYGPSDTIAEAGCGPTALAIAVSSLTDKAVDPLELSNWAADNGYCCPGSGSYRSLIPNGGAHYGLTVTGIGEDAGKLVQALEDGKLVIAIMARGHFTRSGHFIVLRGVTASGNILVADPSSVKRSNQEWPLGIITGEVSHRAGSGGPFWVLEA